MRDGRLSVEGEMMFEWMIHDAIRIVAFAWVIVAILGVIYLAAEWVWKDRR